MGMKWQRMESHALRSAYKMRKEQKGILVRHIQPTYETAKHLKPDDIIMRFDGVQVASDGTVPFRSAFTTPTPPPLPPLPQCSSHCHAALSVMRCSMACKRREHSVCCWRKAGGALPTKHQWVHSILAGALTGVCF